jgi:prephenate dehydrogenase
VIGLGAIGGSVARRAKQVGTATVLGWSPDAAERDAARAQGALDEAPATAVDVARRAQLLVLAAPPAANIQLLETLHQHLPRDAFVTDVGSVKRAIVARAEALGMGARFAGSHPLAGTHEQGFHASRADLLRAAVVYVTPARGGERVAREIADWWETELEAEPVMMTADAHDALVALTSHLPQILASLLGGYLAAHLPEGATLGPGAKGTTRLAASDPALWTEILLMNRDQVLPALRRLEEPLGELERALETGDAMALGSWLGRAADWRRGLDP